MVVVVAVGLTWLTPCLVLLAVPQFLCVTELKAHKDGALSKMALLNQGRLSVQPVSKEEWDFVLSLEKDG